MTGFEWTTVALSVLTLIVVPLAAVVVRLIIRLTRREDKLDRLVDDVRKLVEDKDRIHGEMYRTMRDDRAATDRRLRWLEENLWKNGRRGA